MRRCPAGSLPTCRQTVIVTNHPIDTVWCGAYSSISVESFRVESIARVTLQVSNVEQVAQRLKVLADPTRLRVFSLLMDGTFCNCELGDALDMAPNLISHHLSVLRRAGLVETRRDPLDSRWIYYTVNREALTDLAAQLQLFFDPSRLGSRAPQCGPSAGRN